MYIHTANRKCNIIMNRTLISVSLAFFMLLGCGTRDEIKPTKDSLLTKEAVESIRAIKTAYQKKNRDVLINKLDKAMASEVTAGLFFEKVDLTITPWVVKIRDSRVIVNMDWQGVWNIGGKETKSRGIANFVFEGSPLKLIRVDGDDPFLVVLSRHRPISPPEEAAVMPDEHDSGMAKIVEDKKPDQLTTKMNDTVKKGYVIQVGAWRNPGFAQEILGRLREYYPEAVIVEANNFNKIRIPGVADRNQGNIIIRNIEEKFQLQSILIHNKR